MCQPCFCNKLLLQTIMVLQAEYMTPPQCSNEELDAVLERQRLSVLFQPVADFGAQKIKGYEALIRGPSDSSLHSPLTLFDAANRQGRLLDLELLCREICIRQFRKLDLPGKLFLNVVPDSLLQAGHRSGYTLELLERYGLSPERVVIELTEHYPMDEYDVMREATHHFKSMGFEIAIDDLGAGYAGLRMWSELDPDYVKIDRHFIQDIHEDPVKREFVRSIGEISKTLDCEVIAEGIETIGECEVVCELGINLVQGYYFARPRPIPVQKLEAGLFNCGCKNKTPGLIAHLTRNIGDIAVQLASIPPQLSIEEAGAVFRNAPSSLSLPVVDENNRPHGIVRRQSLMDVLSTQYGLALHGKNPVLNIMEQDSIMVDKAMNVEQVSKYITARNITSIQSDFIITDEGRYFGIGSILDLLKKITDLQIRNARYANPLTLLPGNVPIYELVDRLLSRGATFFIAYCDLDNFKPFNDAYGYSKGDQVLMGLAKIISSAIDEAQDFVGHIGGDDFVIIFRSHDWQQRCEKILADFECRIPSFYQEEHRQQGGIVSENRSGEKVFVPFLSLSVGVAAPDVSRCQSHHDVAALATGAKREAKSVAGNCLYIDRREA